MEYEKQAAATFVSKWESRGSGSRQWLLWFRFSLANSAFGGKRWQFGPSSAFCAVLPS